MASTGFYPFTGLKADSSWYVNESNACVDDSSYASYTHSPGTKIWWWADTWTGPTIPSSALITNVQVKIRSYYNTLSGSYYNLDVGTFHYEYPTWDVRGTRPAYRNWTLTYPTKSVYLYFSGSPGEALAEGDPEDWGYTAIDTTPEDRYARWLDIINGTRDLAVMATLDSGNSSSASSRLEYISMNVEYTPGETGSAIQLGSFG